jgi:hypothetical protein
MHNLKRVLCDFSYIDILMCHLMRFDCCKPSNIAKIELVIIDMHHAYRQNEQNVKDVWKTYKDPTGRETKFRLGIAMLKCDSTVVTVICTWVITDSQPRPTHLLSIWHHEHIMGICKSHRGMKISAQLHTKKKLRRRGAIINHIPTYFTSCKLGADTIDNYVQQLLM